MSPRRPRAFWNANFNETNRGFDCYLIKAARSLPDDISFKEKFL